jgi:hypothetical protein
MNPELLRMTGVAIKNIIILAILVLMSSGVTPAYAYA